VENLVENLRAAYGGKRVLVTGHNGFKGSWLVAFLNYLGAEVYGISLEISEDSPFKDLHHDGSHVSLSIDIRNFMELQKKVLGIDPDLVFHLAAQSLVLDSYEKPRETFEVNVQGSINLFDSLNKTKCVGVVVATTDKVYRNSNEGKIFKESDALWGYDPYSLSKTGVELAITAWRNLPNANACEFIAVRAGNVFGPGDRARNRLLPDLLSSIRSGSVAKVRNPKSIRPWQYVLDPLLGYLMLGARILNHHKPNCAYNFGPSEESFVTVLDLVCRLQVVSDFRFEIEDSGSILESTVLKIDSTLAKNDIGWRSITSLSSGLKYTAAIDRPQLGVKACEKHVIDYLITAQDSMME
jgi:CDP-glucose 4,6-dehydratase